MKTLDAKKILALYRPGTSDADDAEVAAALAQARNEPGLQAWLAQHCATQEALREKFRQIPVPEGLKEAILAQRVVLRLRPWWQQPAWLAAAAAIVLLASLAALWLQPRVPDHFADFRARMVGTALREYRMDLVTNDMSQIRQFMAARGAPADYVVPKGLERLKLTGGGLLRWRNKPVSMVCFDRGDNEMLFLFVLHRNAAKDAPSDTPEIARISNLTTVSWSQGGDTYVLAGPADPDFLRKYL